MGKCEEIHPSRKLVCLCPDSHWKKKVSPKIYNSVACIFIWFKNDFTIHIDPKNLLDEYEHNDLSQVDNITKVLFRKQAYNLSGEMLQ